jgi:acyl-CoA dehydrogenase
MLVSIATVRALPMFFTPWISEWAESLADKLSGTLTELDEPTTVVRGLGQRGLLATLFPEGLGGAAVGMPDRVSVRALCLLREALGYFSPLADSVFAVQGLGTYARVLTGALDASGIKPFIAGDEVAGFALTEPEAGSDVASMRSRAVGEGARFRLTGEKCFISNVGIAHSYVVFANANPDLGKKGISAFVMRANAAGLQEGVTMTGGDHPLGSLSFSGAHATLLGEVGQGLRLALGTLDVFRTSVGAAALGMAQRALDEAVQFVNARVQFGKKLVEFQLTQTALAEMATELDAARLLVYRAAWVKDMGMPGTTEVAMAKMFATEAAQRVIDRAVQLLGGRGVTGDHIVHRLYREVRPLRIYEGTTEIQKLIIGAQFVGRGDA